MSMQNLHSENPTETDPVSVGFLLSGGGRTLENLVEAIQRDDLPAKVDLVIASKAGLGGIERASRAGIPHQIHPCKGSRIQKPSSPLSKKRVANSPYSVVGYASS